MPISKRWIAQITFATIVLSGAYVIAQSPSPQQRLNLFAPLKGELTLAPLDRSTNSAAKHKAAPISPFSRPIGLFAPPSAGKEKISARDDYENKLFSIPLRGELTLTPLDRSTNSVAKHKAAPISPFSRPIGLSAPPSAGKKKISARNHYENKLFSTPLQVPARPSNIPRITSLSDVMEPGVQSPSNGFGALPSNLVPGIDTSVSFDEISKTERPRSNDLFSPRPSNVLPNTDSTPSFTVVPHNSDSLARELFGPIPSNFPSDTQASALPPAKKVVSVARLPLAVPQDTSEPDSEGGANSPSDLPEELEDDELNEDEEEPDNEQDKGNEELPTQVDVEPVEFPAELGNLANQPMSIDEARVAALQHNKDVQVLGWEPRAAAQEIAIEKSFFDPVFLFDGDAGKLDQQAISQVQSLSGASITALQTDFFTPEDDELGQMVLEKQLQTGGKFQVGWNVDYQFNDPFGTFLLVNPGWTSRFTMKLEQPLFRGRGADIAFARIEVARADQAFSTQEFYALVHQTLRDVEIAYWEAALISNEHRWIRTAAERAFRTWQREEKLLAAGRGSLPDALQAEEQYRRIRGELADARNRWGTSSRELYRLMGIPIQTQQGFVEADVSALLETLQFDLDSASYAIRSHPEYLAQYANVQAAQTVLRVELNNLKPDMALRFAYAFSGLAENFDDAVDIMTDGDYTDWTIGLVFRHAFGRRAELANVRKAHLALNRTRAELDRIHHDLLYLYQEGYATANARTELYHEQFKRRMKAEELLEARKKLYEAGRVSLDLQLRAEQSVLSARVDEVKALAAAWTARSELRYTLGEMQ